MKPVAYLFCVTPEMRVSGTLLLETQGEQLPVNVIVRAEEGRVGEALADVYRQLVEAANDAQAPWKEGT